jgi:serine/threonine protein kinase/tetratricopeptide (TPR) repeat protein
VGAGGGAVSPNGATIADERSGDRYEVSSVVAEGGMGRILRARDRRLGRDVAIKELRRPSAELAARFHREITISARLQHPSIVTVHESGTWSNGEPYFVMELISGRALEQVAAAAKTPAERLALVPHVIAVAEALAYAHSNRVIHRDLKPSNVLVGEFGETVVVDWGLAKDLRATDDIDATSVRATGSGETSAGDVVGTPAFMPPEQARGEPVDERADVYSIGALLYALLAGREPFSAATPDAIVRRVISERPTPLDQLAPFTPPDLLAIVDKAMARVATQRYADARELARDLRRFQTGQLVDARRYSAPQLAWRFVRRHRAIVAVATTALVIVGVLANVSIARIVDERDRAESASTLANAERDREESARAGAEQLVSFMLGTLKPKLERLGRLDMMGDVAKQIDSYYRATGSDDSARLPDAVLREVDARQVLGDVFYAAGDSAAANASYRAAIDAASPLATRDGRAAIALARAQTELAASELEDSKLDDAELLLDRARTELGSASPRVDAQLVLGSTMRRLGTLAFQRGKLEASLASLAQCLDVLKPLVDDKSAGRAARIELAKCYDRYSDADSARSNWPDAKQAIRAGLELRQQLASEDPGDLAVQFGIAISWDKLALLALDSNQPADASADTARELAVGEPLIARDPDNHAWGRMIAVAHERLAQVASDEHHPEAAAAAMQPALDELVALAQRDPTSSERAIDAADAYAKQAQFLLDAHQADRALAAVDLAKPLALRASSADPSNRPYAWSVASVKELEGDVQKARGKRTEALAAYRFADAIYDRLVQAEPSNADLAANAATTKFGVGALLADDDGTRAEGDRAMVAALEMLRALRVDGQLPDSIKTVLDELEADYATIKRHLASKP